MNALPGAPREGSLLSPSDFGRSAEFEYLTDKLGEALQKEEEEEEEGGLKDLMRESKMSIPASALYSEKGNELLFKSCNRQYVISTISNDPPVLAQVEKDYMASAATFYSWMDLVKFIRTKQYHDYAAQVGNLQAEVPSDYMSDEESLRNFALMLRQGNELALGQYLRTTAGRLPAAQESVKGAFVIPNAEISPNS